MMYQKVDYWLERMPEPYRSQALKARESALRDCPNVFHKNHQARSINEALKKAFYWGTHGGDYAYWSSVRAKAKNGDFDKAKGLELKAKEIAVAAAVCYSDRLPSHESLLERKAFKDGAEWMVKWMLSKDKSLEANIP